MVPSTAVIYTPGQTPPVQQYDVESYLVAGLVQSNALQIDDIEVLDNGGRIGFAFSRLVDSNFDPFGRSYFLVARSFDKPELS